MGTRGRPPRAASGPYAQADRELELGDGMESYYTVDHVGKRVVIVPSWIDYSPERGEIVILMDPGEAFGTGQHESTRGAISAMEAHLEPGARLFDIGCGSGILSIAAAKLGGPHGWMELTMIPLQWRSLVQM